LRLPPDKQIAHDSAIFSSHQFILVSKSPDFNIQLFSWGVTLRRWRPLNPKATLPALRPNLPILHPSPFSQKLQPRHNIPHHALRSRKHTSLWTTSLSVYRTGDASMTFFTRSAGSQSMSASRREVNMLALLFAAQLAIDKLNAIDDSLWVVTESRCS